MERGEEGEEEVVVVNWMRIVGKGRKKGVQQQLTAEGTAIIMMMMMMMMMLSFFDENFRKGWPQISRSHC